MRSPKLTATARPTWYSYYAGYSTEFVDDVLSQAALTRADVVLDPWNGAGTTTVRALERGLSARGYDVNPALVIVARGRLLPKNVVGSLTSLSQDVLEAAQRTGPSEQPKEGLTRWFNRPSAGRLRAVEESIQRLLIDHEEYLPLSDRQPESLSALASFFYVALFDTVRKLLAGFVGTNPTWIKSPKDNEELLSVGWKGVRHQFLEATERLSERIMAAGLSGDTPIPDHELKVSSSAKLPLADDSVDLVVGSPPYCTRIDYVMATLPELSVLGLGEEESVRRLRHSMIGTPTMQRDVVVSAEDRFGHTANSFLEEVRSHSSKASATYYLKYFYQYFSGMADSLVELRRVAKSEARAVLVVQDSYYKDVHNDLAQAIIDMAGMSGWDLVARADFKARTRASIHPGSRTYRARFTASESVITLG